MILLSFDIEEFDVPFEYNKDISFDDQINISIEGTNHILDILDKHEVRATFFSTVIFAKNAPQVIDRLISAGHELASHGYYHSQFEDADLLKSKNELEELGKTPVRGFRMPRMMPVNEESIAKAGYEYNSSINPTYLPGRYNNLDKPRTYFKEHNIWQIPASVSPLIRFPLFWLSFHNLPLAMYSKLAGWALKKDGYLNIYFHPWEFTNLNDKERFGFPAYVMKNTGEQMIHRMDRFIAQLKTRDIPFVTISDFVDKRINNNERV